MFRSDIGKTLPSWVHLARPSLTAFNIFYAWSNLNTVFGNATLILPNHKKASVRSITMKYIWNFVSALETSLSFALVSFRSSYTRSWKNMIRWLYSWRTADRREGDLSVHIVGKCPRKLTLLLSRRAVWDTSGYFGEHVTKFNRSYMMPKKSQQISTFSLVSCTTRLRICVRQRTCSARGISCCVSACRPDCSPLKFSAPP